VRPGPALVEGPDPLARTVSGSFHRAVDPAHRAAALAGSRSAGRYSPADAPTLYLSASREGVAAAMIAHTGARSPALEVLAVQVVADRIVDLRAHEPLRSIGVDPAAAADWQEILAAGGSPSSWRVRDTLEQLGANGLIDPSRRRPGLWHLVLFGWNRPGAPSVRVAPS